MREIIKTAIMYILIFIAIVVFIVGAYYLAKHGSYWLWYEDMVKETIREMVKPEYLK